VVAIHEAPTPRRTGSAFLLSRLRYVQAGATALAGRRVAAHRIDRGRDHSLERRTGRKICVSNELAQSHPRPRALGGKRSNMVSVLTDLPAPRETRLADSYHLNGPPSATSSTSRASTRKACTTWPTRSRGRTRAQRRAVLSGIQRHLSRRRRNGAPRFSSCRGSSTSRRRFDCSDAHNSKKRYFVYSKRALSTHPSRRTRRLVRCGPKKPGVSQHTPPPITASAFLFQRRRDARTLRRVARETRDARSYAATAERNPRELHTEMFDTPPQLCTDSQCCQRARARPGIPSSDRDGYLLRSCTTSSPRDYAVLRRRGFAISSSRSRQGGRSD